MTVSALAARRMRRHRAWRPQWRARHLLVLLPPLPPLAVVARANGAPSRMLLLRRRRRRLMVLRRRLRRHRLVAAPVAALRRPSGSGVCDCRGWSRPSLHVCAVGPGDLPFGTPPRRVRTAASASAHQFVLQQRRVSATRTCTPRVRRRGCRKGAGVRGWCRAVATKHTCGCVLSVCLGGRGPGVWARPCGCSSTPLVTVLVVAVGLV